MKAIAAGIALIAVLAGAGLLWSYQLIQSPMSLPDSPVLLEVKSGQSLNSLLLELEAEGILQMPRILALWARWQGLDRQIQAGEYELQSGLTGISFLNLLASGEVRSYRITLPEGITLSEALERLHTDARLGRELQGVDDPRLLDLVAPYESAEGWFLPETYQYVAGDTDLDILRRAHKLMEQGLNQAWAARAGGGPLIDPYEALILASIVERETSVAEERPQIAGVFSRRLERGMRLQTDPTVIYGLGASFDGNLKRRHLRDETNPWNTYQIKGLPPSPIALPGVAALRAAVNPQAGDALYFVARGDGYHVFSASLEEHNANVRRYQLSRKAEYRSTPQKGN